MQRLGSFFTQLARKALPDPFVLAILLTLAVLIVGEFAPTSSALREKPLAARAGALAGIWLESVWNPALLTFALQMCIVLLAGFGLARAPLALRGLRFLAGRARSNRGAVTLIALTSCAGCWINWGFGLVLAGLLAVEVRRSLTARGVGCQYALIVAAAYCGMMIWHGGLSGSAPLKVAGEGVKLPSAAVAVAPAGEPAGDVPPIPLTQTTFSLANLVLSVVLIAGVPLVLRQMAARTVALEPNSAESGADPGAPPGERELDAGEGIAGRLNRSRAVSTTLGLLFAAGLVREVVTRGVAAVELNFVNGAFLAVGLLLHRNLMTYLAAVLEGGRAIVGIVLQFPLYAGIQGMMVASGLAVTISTVFVDGATAVGEASGLPVAWLFPIAAFVSAGLVNFMVPSGGGQWIVQGPIMCSAAASLGLSIPSAVMAVSYGDQWTNMVQPFWAMPLIGMTAVSPREFMGYCAVVMLLAGPVIAVSATLV
jgi:short-chain fatty acids transporter